MKMGNAALRRDASDPADESPEPVRSGGGRGPMEPSVGSGGNGLTRVTVNLTRPAVQALELLSEATGYSKTDTINRALQISAIVQRHMERNGGLLILQSEDGQTERLHIV